MSESSVVEDKPGVNAGVVGVVVGTAGDKALKEAPEATFRTVGASVVGVIVSSVATLPVASGSRWPEGFSWFSDGERRGVEAMSREPRVTVAAEPV